MARQYFRLSQTQLPLSAQGTDIGLGPVLNGPVTDERQTPLQESNTGGVWPVGQNPGMGIPFFKSAAVKIPKVRALTLAPHTDVDGCMIRFKGETTWRFLGPGIVLFPLDGSSDEFDAQPAFLIPQNVDQGAGQTVHPVFFGDCVLEVFTGECPPAGFSPKLLPFRVYQLNDFYSPFLVVDAATLNAAGQPMQVVLATCGYNVERAEYLFGVSGTVGNKVRAAIAHGNIATPTGKVQADRDTAGKYAVQEQYVEVTIDANGGRGAAAMFDGASPWLAVLVGTPSVGGSQVIEGSSLTLVRRFIG